MVVGSLVAEKVPQIFRCGSASAADVNRLNVLIVCFRVRQVCTISSQARSILDAGQGTLMEPFCFKSNILLLKLYLKIYCRTQIKSPQRDQGRRRKRRYHQHAGHRKHEKCTCQALNLDEVLG